MLYLYTMDQAFKFEVRKYNNGDFHNTMGDLVPHDLPIYFDVKYVG